MFTLKYETFSISILDGSSFDTAYWHLHPTLRVNDVFPGL